MQDSPRQLGGEVMTGLGESAQRGVDPQRLVDQPAHHHRGRVFGRDRRNRVEPPRRLDHRGCHQRHVDVGECDVVGKRFGGNHFRERVERGLGGQIGAVLRAACLHAGAGHVDDVTESALTPMRQQCQHHPHRTEVVDRHHPLVVMQPVGLVDDRSADRPARVVHQVVDVIEAAQDVLDGVFHRRGVGDVAGEGVGLAAIGANLGDQIIECIAVTGQCEYRRAPFGDRDGRCPADATGGSGDDHVPADQRSVRVVAAGPVGIEVLGPVPPQRGRITGELGHRNAGAAQCFLGLLGDEGRGQVDDVEDLAGDAQLGGHHVAPNLGPATHFEHRCGHRPGERAA